MSDDSLKPPKRGKGDAAHMLVKAALSAVPVAGGSAAEIMAYLIEPPLSKRRAQWAESVVEKLKELEEAVEGFSVEHLLEDESFVTTYVNATRSAISEHREEKINALRNAVLNAALPSAPDDDNLALFLNYIDRLTTWHLRLLAYFGSDLGHGEFLTVRFPELQGRHVFYILLIDDLIACGLLIEDVDSLQRERERARRELKEDENYDEDYYEMVTRRNQDGTLKSPKTLAYERATEKLSRVQITNLGREFLAFITSPIEESE
jgi:hypothetical protein